MPDYTPKIIEVPGIPGPLREQTLDEFMSPLALDHLARKELMALRERALETVDLANKLAQVQTRVIELQEKLIGLSAPAPVPTPTPTPLEAPLVAEPDPWPKEPCAVCGKLISSAPGPKASHMKTHVSSPVNVTT